MKKIKVLFSVLAVVSVLLCAVSCNNAIAAVDTSDKNVEEVKSGSITARIFIPDYQKMAENARVIAPGTTKAKLRYFDGVETKETSAELIKTGSLDGTSESGSHKDFPGVVAKVEFSGIPVRTYKPGELKVYLLDDNEKPLSAGENKVEVLYSPSISADPANPSEPSVDVAFATYPVDENGEPETSGKSGTVETGQMNFWQLPMEDRTCTLTISGTPKEEGGATTYIYPYIVLFREDASFKEFLAVNPDNTPSNESPSPTMTVSIPPLKEGEGSSYIVGIYADATGDDLEYSILDVQIPSEILLSLAETDDGLRFEGTGTVVIPEGYEIGLNSSNIFINNNDTGDKKVCAVEIKGGADDEPLEFVVTASYVSYDSIGEYTGKIGYTVYDGSNNTVASGDVTAKLILMDLPSKICVTTKNDWTSFAEVQLPSGYSIELDSDPVITLQSGEEELTCAVTFNSSKSWFEATADVDAETAIGEYNGEIRYKVNDRNNKFVTDGVLDVQTVLTRISNEIFLSPVESGDKWCFSGTINAYVPNGYDFESDSFNINVNGNDIYFYVEKREISEDSSYKKFELTVSAQLNSEIVENNPGVYDFNVHYSVSGNGIAFSDNIKTTIRFMVLPESMNFSLTDVPTGSETLPISPSVTASLPSGYEIRPDSTSVVLRDTASAAFLPCEIEIQKNALIVKTDLTGETSCGEYEGTVSYTIFDNAGVFVTSASIDVKMVLMRLPNKIILSPVQTGDSWSYTGTAEIGIPRNYRIGVGSNEIIMSNGKYDFPFETVFDSENILTVNSFGFPFDDRHNGNYTGTVEYTVYDSMGNTSEKSVSVEMTLYILPSAWAFEYGSTAGLEIGSNGSDWQITNDSAYSGTYSLKSMNSGMHNTSATVELTVEDCYSISYRFKLSSESGYDYLRFYIDGSLLGDTSWCGEVNWATYYNDSLETGTHTFKWVYSKDGSVNNGSDCAWIDDIEVGKAVAFEPVIFDVLSFEYTEWGTRATYFPQFETYHVDVDDVIRVSGTLFLGEDSSSTGKATRFVGQDTKGWSYYSIIYDPNGIANKVHRFSYDWTVADGQQGDHHELMFLIYGDGVQEGDTIPFAIQDLTLTKISSGGGI